MKKDLTFVIGAFSAKVGYNNSFYERVMGRDGCGVMNEKGEQFAVEITTLLLVKTYTH